MVNPYPTNIVDILNKQDSIKTKMMNGHRWYYDSSNPEPTYRMSMTSGLNVAYPKGPGLFEWGVKSGYWHKMLSDTAIVPGNLVHDAIDLLFQGQTIDDVWFEIALMEQEKIGWRLESNKTTIINSCLRYMESFFAWYDKFQPVCIGSEFKLYNEEHLFAGRTDQLYKITDEKTGETEIVLVDNKTGTAHDYHWIQGLGYAHIYNTYYAPEEYKCTKVGVLYLKKDYRKKPNYSFKMIDANPERYLNYCDWYVNEFKVPVIKFGYLPRRKFSLVKQNKESK